MSRVVGHVSADIPLGCTACVFTDRLRKSIQGDFSTIYFGGLGLGFRVRVLVVVRVWVRVTVGARVMVGVWLVRG